MIRTLNVGHCKNCAAVKVRKWAGWMLLDMLWPSDLDPVTPQRRRSAAPQL
jgi:hypothetical protein